MQVVIGEVYDLYCTGFGCVRVWVARSFVRVRVAWSFLQPPFPPIYIFNIFVFLIFFHIFCVVVIFLLLISYFLLTSYFEVSSKPATSCSNLSLIVDGQGVPGHATF